MRIKISARKSDLARIQAYFVGAAIQRKNPLIEIEYRFRESLGDINQNDPLWKMPERGVFTNDFYNELIEGETDLVVHSWKDLPTEERDGTEIAATLPRADCRDLVLFKESTWKRVASQGSLRVFSSSPRRAYNLEPFFKSHLPASIQTVEFLSVRGNVATRVRKLLEDDSVDALVVAKAALDRLLTAGEEDFPEKAHFLQVSKDFREKLSHCRFMVLPLSLNPAAAAQGALAIEIKKGRDDLKKILLEIHHPETEKEVRKEREILKTYGGGCHQKIGVSVLSRSYGDVTFLRGLTDQGQVLDSHELASRDSKGALPKNKCWPLPSDDDKTFFNRKPISIDPRFLQNKSLWIARSEALPENFIPSPTQLVWVAGLESWKKLASRGVWVHGSSEGLGEGEDPRLDALRPQKMEWLKLSHSETPESSRFPVLATYDLITQSALPHFSGHEYFFWMSGSSFLRALEADPKIRDASHFCGPGHTYQMIRKALGPTAKITIEISYSNWLKRLA